MKIKKHGLLDNPVSDDMRYSENRRYLLDSFKKKQNFRVSYGIGKWFYYRDFSMKIKLRQVMDDEIVIEFDSTTYERELGVKWEEMNEIEKNYFKEEISLPAIESTRNNLYNAGLLFEIWSHEGKSPHIHIHNLPIAHLSKKERKLWKETFIKNYVSKKYHKYMDLSLCGIHLVALEWCKHYKGDYRIKIPINNFKEKYETKN